MTSIIFSPQPGDVGPIAPNKMTTVISDSFYPPRSVPHGVLGPRFGPHLNALSFLTIFSQLYVTICSHLIRSSDQYMTVINNVLYFHDYMVFFTSVKATI